MVSSSEKPIPINQNHVLEVNDWLFDLDNTLYASSTKVFDQIAINIVNFLREFLNLSEAQAKEAQQHYSQNHGTTLAGLQAEEHEINPTDYFDYVHKVDISHLKPCNQLQQGLSKLMGRKIIYTNATAKHANRIMDQLHIRHFFDDIFDIEESGYICKPNKSSFDQLIEKHGVVPQKSMFFEDLPRNLKTASQLGFKTVLVSEHTENKTTPKENYIDYTTTNLPVFLDQLSSLQKE